MCPPLCFPRSHGAQLGLGADVCDPRARDSPSPTGPALGQGARRRGCLVSGVSLSQLCPIFPRVPAGVLQALGQAWTCSQGSPPFSVFSAAGLSARRCCLCWEGSSPGQANLQPRSQGAGSLGTGAWQQGLDCWFGYFHHGRGAPTVPPGGRHTAGGRQVRSSGDRPRPGGVPRTHPGSLWGRQFLSLSSFCFVR